MELSTLLAQWLARRDDLTAVESGPWTWSYTELDQITRDRAALLRQSVPGQSIPGGGRVMLAGEHTADALIWALAVMRAGLIYTPVSPGLPAERLREAVRVAAPGLVICCPADVATALGQAGAGGGDLGTVVAADDLARAVRPGGKAPASWPAAPVAYSIFTSGSTGLPKLVNVGHGGIENLCRAQTRLFGLEPGQRVLQFSSLSFDAAIAELLVTLSAGATLVVPGWDGGSWIAAVSLHLREHGCDLVTLPPSVYARLDEQARKAIGTVVFAGEALSEVEFGIAARYSRVLNAYGPTEGTVCFSVAEPTRFTTSVGYPIDGYTARVYDSADGRYRAAGRGELVLVGDGVALGYEDPAADEADGAGPFTTVGGRPAYHTGDDVDLRDGEVFYVGRLDEQIKRLGHRVDLTALEGRLSRLLDSRVALVTDDSALVLVHAAADRPGPELTGWLRQVLPSWEVPDVVLAVPHIPVTGTGKADKNKLRALARQAGRDEGSSAAGAGAGGDLAVVRGIAERVLGSELDRTTSLYDAGGSSFTLVQIQTELAQIFGEEPVQAAFDQLDYDFTIDGFLAALRGLPALAPAPAQRVFRAVCADLAGLPAALTALRPARTSTPGAIVITGAGGFIGGHILDRVLGTGQPVTVVTTSTPRRLAGRHCARFGRGPADFADVRFLGYDDLTGDDLAGSTGRWGAVIHCGYAVNHVLPLERQLTGSIASTRALVRAAAAAGAHRFVFLSAASAGPRFLPFTQDTLTAIGDPYSQSKVVAEAYATALDGDRCHVDLLRAGLVYGHTPRDSAFLDNDVFASLLRLSAQHGIVPRLGGLIPVCHVADVAQAALTAAAAGTAAGARDILVQRTYDLDALRAEPGFGAARLVDPAHWLRTVTDAGSADPRILAALQLWLSEAGWAEPVTVTDRPIISELWLTLRDAA
jgi:acyl-coenzyme A synthetase/AMP-(fatty) acid ligase/nucleoside-diphosphate-sugar epimerase